MCKRESSSGELLWTPNMVMSGVGGAPSTHQGHMGWGFEGILVGGRGCFLAIPYLIREMGPRLNSGMMCDVETQASRKLSQVYIIWLV